MAIKSAIISEKQPTAQELQQVRQRFDRPGFGKDSAKILSQYRPGTPVAYSSPQGTVYGAGFGVSGGISPPISQIKDLPSVSDLPSTDIALASAAAIISPEIEGASLERWQQFEKGSQAMTAQTIREYEARTGKKVLPSKFSEADITRLQIGALETQATKISSSQASLQKASGELALKSQALANEKQSLLSQQVQTEAAKSAYLQNPTEQNYATAVSAVNTYNTSVQNFSNKISAFESQAKSLEAKEKALDVDIARYNLRSSRATAIASQIEASERQKAKTQLLTPLSQEYPLSKPREIFPFAAKKGQEAAMGTAKFLSGITGGIVPYQAFGFPAVLASGIEGISSGVGAGSAIVLKKISPQTKGEIQIKGFTKKQLSEIEKGTPKGMASYVMSPFFGTPFAPSIYRQQKQIKELGLEKEVQPSLSPTIAYLPKLATEFYLIGGVAKPFILTGAHAVTSPKFLGTLKHGVAKLPSKISKPIIKRLPSPTTVLSRNVNIQTQKLVGELEKAKIGKKTITQGVYDVKAVTKLTLKTTKGVKTRVLPYYESGVGTTAPARMNVIDRVQNYLQSKFGLEQKALKRVAIRTETGTGIVKTTTPISRTVAIKTPKPIVKPLAEGKGFIYGVKQKILGIEDVGRQRLFFKGTEKTVGIQKQLGITEKSAEWFKSAQKIQKNVPAKEPVFVYGRHAHEIKLVEPQVAKLKAQGYTVVKVPPEFSKIRELGLVDRARYNEFLAETFKGRPVIDLHSDFSMPAGTVIPVKQSFGIRALEVPKQVGLRSQEAIADVIKAIKSKGIVARPEAIGKVAQRATETQQFGVFKGKAMDLTGAQYKLRATSFLEQKIYTPVTGKESLASMLKRGTTPFDVVSKNLLSRPVKPIKPFVFDTKAPEKAIEQLTGKGVSTVQLKPEISKAIVKSVELPKETGVVLGKINLPKEFSRLYGQIQVARFAPLVNIGYAGAFAASVLGTKQLPKTKPISLPRPMTITVQKPLEVSKPRELEQVAPLQVIAPRELEREQVTPIAITNIYPTEATIVPPVTIPAIVPPVIPAIPFFLPPTSGIGEEQTAKIKAAQKKYYNEWEAALKSVVGF